MDLKTESRTPGVFRWASATLLAAVIIGALRSVIGPGASVPEWAVGIAGAAYVVCAVLLWRGSPAGRMVTLFCALAGLTVGAGLILLGDATLAAKALALVMQVAFSAALLFILLGEGGRWQIVGAMALFLLGYALPAVVDMGVRQMAPAWQQDADPIDLDGDMVWATPMPGTLRQRGDIEFGRFEHCDADGCLALEMPVDGAEDGEASLWAEGDDWIMSATLYALDTETMAAPGLMQDSLAFCADWLVEIGEITTYEVTASDVGDRRSTYQLDITGPWGSGMAYVYLEATDEQLIELCIYGADDASEMEAVFDRARDTIEITAEPGLLDDGNSVTPAPGTSGADGTVTYGRFEHCDLDGCFAIEMPADLTLEDESSLYCGGEAWIISAIVFGDEGEPDDPDPSLDEVVQTAIDGWYDSGAVASIDDAKTDVGKHWIRYSAECVDVDGIRGQCYVYAETELGRIKALWGLDYDPQVNAGQVFEHARETFVITD